MKKIIIIGIFMILIIPIVLSQEGGGGTPIRLSPEEVYEISDEFTKCLIDNCDYFCKEYGLDIGYYYDYGKCWCEKNIQTIHGNISSDEGWIKIEECSQEYIDIKSNGDESSCKNLKRLNKVLMAVIVIMIVVIIIIIIGIVQMYQKNDKLE